MSVGPEEPQTEVLLSHILTIGDVRRERPIGQKYRGEGRRGQEGVGKQEGEHVLGEGGQFALGGVQRSLCLSASLPVPGMKSWNAHLWPRPREEAERRGRG